MWGSEYTNCSGRSLAEALDVHDLVVLNTTTPTHFSLTGRNAWSLLDLVLVSSSCASLCTCTVTSEFLGSDHCKTMRTPHRKTMVSRNGTSPEQTGRNLAPPVIKLWLLSPSHWATPIVSLKLVFAKLLWKLFHNPKSLLKSLFHGGISSATLLWKRKSTPSKNETDLGFKWYYYFQTVQSQG